MRRHLVIGAGLTATALAGTLLVVACAGQDSGVTIPATGVEAGPGTTGPVYSAPPTLSPVSTIAVTTPAPAPSTAPPTVAPTVAPSPAPGSPILLPVAAPAGAVVPVSPGTRGESVRMLQQRLLDAGFWLDAADGRYGWATSQAVMAFQKYYGLPEASGAVDQATADALNTTRFRALGSSRQGDLIEVNLTKQLMHIVRGGTTLWTVNVSTGSGVPYVETSKKEPGETVSGDAITPEGEFKVSREKPEGWWEGELGELYRPKYFRGGIAVHGASNVPNYPASHGCVRVSLPAMDFIWAENLMPIGSPVWVHR